MTNSAPSANQIELSVFGRGFGEAICFHLGDNEWIAVDSCLNPLTRKPAAVSYLEEIGVDPATAVKAVVATHWHDDHVQGLVDLVKACPSALVVCSLALFRKEIFSFVVEQQGAGGSLGSGVDEFRELLRFCNDNARKIVWAKENLPIFPRPPGPNPDVIALSPSEDACERSLLDIIQKATKGKSVLRRRFRAPEGPNGGSVALWAKRNGSSVILGADLETSANPNAGWDAVLAGAKPHSLSSAFKIPHHGSSNAHHDDVWGQLLSGSALAIVTPWIRGKRFLPKPADLKRLRQLTPDVYLTADPQAVLKRKKDKDLQKVHTQPVLVVSGWGHVRARQTHGLTTWSVELSGDAKKIG